MFDAIHRVVQRNALCNYNCTLRLHTILNIMLSSLGYISVYYYKEIDTSYSKDWNELIQEKTSTDYVFCNVAT